MLIASDGQGHRITPPASGAVAFCPLCHGEVLAKCGTLVVHHWAHRAQESCHDWGEGETDWHRSWKSLVPVDQRECVIEVDGVRHRADMVVPDPMLSVGSFVIEVQHSSISAVEIRERERFYGRMAWIVDARDARDRIDLERKEPQGLHPAFRSFYWEHPRRSLTASRMPIWLDMGDQLLGIGSLRSGGALGYGHLWSRTEFIRRVLRPLPLTPPEPKLPYVLPPPREAPPPPEGLCPKCGGTGWHPPCRIAPNPLLDGMTTHLYAL